MTSTKNKARFSVACLIIAPSLLLGVSRANAQAPAEAPIAKSQTELANPKAVFGTIASTDPKAKAALEAHNLTAAKGLVGKPGTVIGTVAGIYAPKGNKIVILNLDRDYKTAIAAVVGSEDFAKFPDLKSLMGKKVVLSGKFKAYKESSELVLTAPGDVKIVK